MNDLDKFMEEKEEHIMIRARKINFMEYFSYFEGERLRKDLLNRIENKRSNRLKEVLE